MGLISGGVCGDVYAWSCGSCGPCGTFCGPYGTCGTSFWICVCGGVCGLLLVLLGMQSHQLRANALTTRADLLLLAFEFRESLLLRALAVSP